MSFVSKDVFALMVISAVAFEHQVTKKKNNKKQLTQPVFLFKSHK